MVSILKIIGGLSCSFLLAASRASALQPPERLCGNGQPTLAKCESTPRTVNTVSGHVLRVEFNDLVFQRSDGKEVRLHIDENTEMIGYVGPGEHIEAKVNDKRYALSVVRVVE